MVSAVRLGASVRAVAKLFRVSLATFHLWTKQSDKKRLLRSFGAAALMPRYSLKEWQ